VSPLKGLFLVVFVNVFVLKLENEMQKVKIRFGERPIFLRVVTQEHNNMFDGWQTYFLLISQSNEVLCM
jgi:hypothetical protein